MTGLVSTFTTPTKSRSLRGGFQKTSSRLVESTSTLFNIPLNRSRIGLLCTSYKANNKYVAKLIESLDMQNHALFQLLVVCEQECDFVTWHTLLEPAKFNWALVHEPTFVGRSASFKRGVELLNTEYIFVLDDDDFLNVNAVSVLEWVISKATGYNVFVSNHSVVNFQGVVTEHVEYNPHEQRLDVMRTAFKQRHLWGFSRSLIEEFPILIESPYVCEDYWFFAQLAFLNLPAFHIPKPLYFYRDNPYGLRRAQDTKMRAMIKDIRSMVEKNIKQRTIGSLLADCIMAERVIRSRNSLFAS